jgi:hypothetical protein
MLNVNVTSARRVLSLRTVSITSSDMEGKKVNLSLCVTKHDAMKTLLDVYFHAPLGSELDRCELSASRVA